MKWGLRESAEPTTLLGSLKKDPLVLRTPYPVHGPWRTPVLAMPGHLPRSARLAKVGRVGGKTPPWCLPTSRMQPPREPVSRMRDARWPWPSPVFVVGAVFTPRGRAQGDGDVAMKC